MPNKDLEEFLKLGVKHYGEAYETVRFFREEMAQKLEAIGQSRRTWGKFILNKKGDIFSSGQGKYDGWGCWVYAFAHGSLPKNIPAVLEYGIWWNVPKIEQEVIFYANVYEGPSEARKFEIDSNHDAEIRSIYLDRKSRLYLIPGTNPDINHEFNRLLNRLLEAI